MDYPHFRWHQSEAARKFGKNQSKEDFFCTKRKLKRMKTSICLSEPIIRQNTPFNFDDLSLIGEPKDNSLNEELEFTFGFEEPLTFSPKVHRRKHLKKLTLQPEEEAQKEGDTGIDLSIDSVFNCKILGEEDEDQITQDNSHLQERKRSFSIEDFIIFQKLGQGTYSEVFKAQERETGFICAIKILNKKRLKEENLEKNLMLEIKLCSFMDHPNISKLYGFFDDEHLIYLITEYATEKTLYHHILDKPSIQLKKGMKTDKVVDIVGQLCAAIKYLHNHSIIHRDVKPENVLLTMFDTVKICDFGWAVYCPNNEMRSTICGTVLYMAPEVIKMDDYDESVDVWAIGVLTYEMLTQKSPFKVTKMSDVSKIVNDEVSFGGIRNKTAIEFMSKALQKNPGKRKNIYELSGDPFLKGFRSDYAFDF